MNLNGIFPMVKVYTAAMGIGRRWLIFAALMVPAAASFAQAPSAGGPVNETPSAAPTLPPDDLPLEPQMGPGRNPMEPVKVIIGFSNPPGGEESQLVNLAGGEVSRAFRRAVNAVAAEVPLGGVELLRELPNVTSIEYDRPIYAVDAELDSAWGVKHIQSQICHAGGIKGGAVKVAVIDSGIDHTHPDLAPLYAGGYDFVNGDSDPMDDNGHGSHCAGIVAAIDNSMGVVGVAPKVELYGLKVLGASGGGSYSSVIAAVEWCIDNGIQVTSNSYGSGGYPGTSVETAFLNAQNAGIVNVAAAGNSGNSSGTGDNVIYPGRFDSCIAVAAVNSSNQRASFSSTGSAVEIAAPGVSVFSTYKNNGYTTLSGTSMATPHVSGVVALMIDAGITDPAVIRQTLQTTAIDLGAAGRDAFYGFGLVNAPAAVNPPPNGNDPDVTIAGPLEGQEFALGDLTYFEGQAIDAEEGDLSANLLWTSSLDGGPFLPGTPQWATYLTEGTHVLTAEVEDAGGRAGSDSVTVTVVNHPPEVTILSPGNGAEFETGTSIGFSATVTDTDPVDGDITADDLTWTSSLQGIIGSGASFSAVLNEGEHEITASVTDNYGKTGSQSINVAVGPPPPPPDNTVYEDAEDGGTLGWYVYDTSPSGASIGNEFDPDRGSRVIVLSGAGLDNGYMLLGPDWGNWNNTDQFFIEWSMNFGGDFRIYVKVLTDLGARYIYYTPESVNRLGSGTYIHHGLGAASAGNTWQTHRRNLAEDLKDAQPGTTLLAVNAFLVRGSGKVDDIALQTFLELDPAPPESTVYENAEDGTTTGWYVYDGVPSGAVIGNEFDADRGSRAIVLSGSGLGNGYQLNAPDWGYWNNATQFNLRWSMKYAEDFRIYVRVSTTAGLRYLYYSPSETDSLGGGTYIHHGLGAGSRDGTWRTFTRDLRADLQDAQPGATLLEVDAFLVRGSGRFDDIELIGD